MLFFLVPRNSTPRWMRSDGMVARYSGRAPSPNSRPLGAKLMTDLSPYFARLSNTGRIAIGGVRVVNCVFHPFDVGAYMHACIVHSIYIHTDINEYLDPKQIDWVSVSSHSCSLPGTWYVVCVLPYGTCGSIRKGLL